MREAKFLSMIGVDASERLDAALAEDMLASDRLMMMILWAHWFAASTIMGIAYGQYLMGFIGGGVICGIAWTAQRMLPGSPYTRMLMGASLMLFSGLFIQQNMGRIEIHFHVFCALAFLIRYKSMLPLLGAVLTAATHHFVMNYCQSIGLTVGDTPLTIFNYGPGWGTVFLHAGFVVFEATFLGYIIIALTRQFADATQQSGETLDVLAVLERVLRTRDTSQQMDADSEHAHVVNALLDMINSQVAVNEAMQRASTGLLIADKNGAILEVNQAASELFASLQGAYQGRGVSFEAKDLRGRELAPLLADTTLGADLAELNSTRREEFQLGQHVLEVTANPVVNAQGERLGAIVEWEEVTDQRHIEGEVQTIVSAAQNGDLRQRLELSGKHGFYADLSRAMNQLLETVSSALDNTTTVFAAISKGDLSRHMQGEYSGQFRALQDDTNATIDRLRGVVQDIQSSADSLTNASNELQHANTGLSQRTEEQAAGIEETAAAMEEMASNVRQTATYAQQASNSASSIRDQAEQSKEISEQAVSAMDSINESSTKIVNIIGVIDEIAFQTNLLALNASVEAARAGDQGRGFAVVASEVRQLAGRSATAAKEIKSLIEDSAARVEQGSEQVNRAGGALTDIMGAVGEMTGIIEEIARASQEQADGIDQVNHAISSMEQATQRNASMMSQASDAGRATGAQADQLRSLIEFFRLRAENGSQQARVA